MTLLLISDLESRNIPIDKEVSTVENDFSPGETGNVEDDLSEVESPHQPKKLNEGSMLDQAMTRKEDLPIVNKRQAKEDGDYATDLVRYLKVVIEILMPVVLGYFELYHRVLFKIIS